MRRTTCVGAVLEGMIAGAIGSGVQSLFFRATRPITPRSPPDVFEPPEPEQREENQTETIARRLVEQVAHRGPLSKPAKRLAGELVHYGFGAAWGGLYGLLRASYPSLRSPAGVAAFSLGVWLLGDELMLPAFNLANWPQRYPLRVHAYAVLAHLVYGAGVAAALATADQVDGRRSLMRGDDQREALSARSRLKAALIRAR